MWKRNSEIDIDDSPAKNLRSRTALKKKNSNETSLSKLPEKSITPKKRRNNVESSSQISSPGMIGSKLNQLKISSPAKIKKFSKSPKVKNHSQYKKNLEIAAKKLHGSAIPNVLVSRDSEIQQIEQFIESQLKNLTGGCLYVSGVPGSGKTATVSSVVHAFKKKNPSRLKLLEVNCMNITEPKQIYCFIHKALFNKKTTPKNALEILTSHFIYSNKPTWPKLFLVLDEMDLLWTRRQDVLYNMFDWPSHSSLAVIAISNTIDLPERLLSQRVASRLGPNRVSFKPYTFSELTSIVVQRVKDLDIFDDEAIEFASRKISSVSGDARSILSVCRRLIEAQLVSLENESKCGKFIIGIRDMDKIFARIHNSPKICAIRNLSLVEKLALRSLMNTQRSLSVDHVPLHSFYSNFVDVLRSEGHHYGTSHSHFMDIVFTLASSYLITIEDARHGSCKSVVTLNVSFDDVLMALF